MGQYFQLIAPQAEMALSWCGKLGEILTEGSAKELVRLLAVPVRPQYDSPQSSLVGSNNIICKEKRGAKRSRDDSNVHAGSPRCRKQIKVQDRDEETTSSAVIGLSDLSVELHRLIFSFMGNIGDVVALSITSQYYLSIGREYLEDYYTSQLGLWAGTNIVCVGDYVEPNDYPPGLFSNQRLEILRRMTIGPSEDCSDSDYEEAQNRPFTLFDFTNSNMSTLIGTPSNSYDISHSVMVSCLHRHITGDPGYDYIRRYNDMLEKSETHFPTNQQWILRNLTTRQIVRSEAIALSPEYISGPDIEVLGFGEVVMSRICWSTDSSVSMNDQTNISRGVWAGHRFDITTLSRHKDETRGEEWSDASEEVAKEIASIWEGEYGSNWREIICKEASRGYRNPATDWVI
ncbi:hypothetical protein F5Y03DRAFT_62859 [Xylaria venustula]|nr:hypothetical protein F5Y03DRAFT_62859 [Xylaria venustula]